MDDRVRRTLETYEEVADEYASIHGDRERIAEMLALFRDAVPATGRVLDVGCGPGWESETFESWGYDVVAFDLARRFLAQAGERAPEATHVRGDMRSLPFVDGAFDGLWACASLLHVPETAVGPTVAEFERVLRPGGAAVVSLKRQTGSAPGTDGSPYDDDRRFFERYEPADARALFERAEFDDVSLETTEDWVAVEARCSD